MKAFEWVKLLKEDFAKGMKEYLLETKQLLDTRRCSTASAIEGVVREQRNKWIRISESLPETDKYLFDDLLEVTMPDVWLIACKVQMDKVIRQQRRINSLEYKKARLEVDKETDPSLRLGLLVGAILIKLDADREVQDVYGAGNASVYGGDRR